MQLAEAGKSDDRMIIVVKLSANEPNVFARGNPIGISTDIMEEKECENDYTLREHC